MVAGHLGGRRFEVVDAAGLRPTSERARGAIFNGLHSVLGARPFDVVDLFAGSGALGFEAASRGARQVLMVESDRAVAAALRRNIDALGVADVVSITRGDALVAAGDTNSSWGWGDEAAAGVVVADPPYAFERWSELLARLAARPWVEVVVAESDRSVEGAVPAGWSVSGVKRYGIAHVTTFRTDPPSRGDG